MATKAQLQKDAAIIAAALQDPNSKASRYWKNLHTVNSWHAWHENATALDNLLGTHLLTMTKAENDAWLADAENASHHFFPQVSLTAEEKAEDESAVDAMFDHYDRTGSWDLTKNAR